MGNRQEQKLGLPKYEWTWVSNHNGTDLYKRQSDGVISEKRLITLDHRYTLEKEQEIYKLRQKNNLGFVKVYQVEGVEENKDQEKSNFCKCGYSTKLNVYTERIEHRLSELPQLTFAESLHILWETTNSFQQIYQRYGPFHINGQLIGIDTDNKVKVWLNDNFAMNHPSHDMPYLKTVTSTDLPPQLRNEHEMIQNLLEVVEEKTENGKYPQTFGEGAYNNSKSFHEIKRFLNNYMQNEYQDYIPNIIKRSTVIASPQQINHYSQPPPSYTHPQPSQTSSHRPFIDSRPQQSFIVQPLSHNQPVYPPQQTLPSDQNTIKQSFIQTIYHPIKEGEKVNSAPPPTYNFPLSATFQKPSITFGNIKSPQETSLHFNHHSPPQHPYISSSQQPPPSQNYPISIGPSQNLQGKGFPRFELNPSDYKPSNGSVTMTTGSNVGKSNDPGKIEPDSELQRIKNMLKQDIDSIREEGKVEMGNKGSGV